MDESSSKYVDKLAMSKLLREKLSYAHHAPEGDFSVLCRPLYTDFSQLSPQACLRYDANGRIFFSSPVSSPYPENNSQLITPFEISGADRTIVFLHGLFDDNQNIYHFLFRELNGLGYNIYLMTLPYHFERRPIQSRFSGEYFWSANVHRSRRAFKQAVYELSQFSNTIRKKNNHPVFILSFSMGCGISLTLATLNRVFEALFLINPVCSLSQIVWDSPLCKTIKADLNAADFSQDKISTAYAAFEPASLLNSETEVDRIAMAYGLYDQITPYNQYKHLIRTWRLTNVTAYHSGHLNALRVPRLALDIHSFFTNFKNGN